ncbi:hypothetical protein AAC387_Pa03g0383 [Persea americana]
MLPQPYRIRVSFVRVCLLSSTLCSPIFSPQAKNAVPQDLHDQEEAGEEDEAEQAHPSLDPHEDRQHHQVQCEAQALASHKVRVLRQALGFIPLSSFVLGVFRYLRDRKAVNNICYRSYLELFLLDL